MSCNKLSVCSMSECVTGCHVNMLIRTKLLNSPEAQLKSRATICRQIFNIKLPPMLLVPSNTESNIR